MELQTWYWIALCAGCSARADRGPETPFVTSQPVDHRPEMPRLEIVGRAIHRLLVKNPHYIKTFVATAPGFGEMSFSRVVGVLFTRLLQLAIGFPQRTSACRPISTSSRVGYRVHAPNLTEQNERIESVVAQYSRRSTAQGAADV